MADIKNSEAPLSTTTIDKNKVDAPTNNIYEAISIISKRANQINGDIKKELLEKLDEFATYNDSLEEIFENKEQIEVSKFYEKLPKPHSLAVQEWLEDKIYYRNTAEGLIMTEIAWLMLAVGDNRQHAGNEGYDDDPATHYSWDDTVPNCSRPRPGQRIVLWDKNQYF